MGKVEQFFEGWKPVAWIDEEGERVTLTVAGPDKPMKNGKQELQDVYTVTFDVLDYIEDFVSVYDDLGGPVSDEQREDLRERAGKLRRFAEAVTALADRAAAQAK